MVIFRTLPSWLFMGKLYPLSVVLCLQLFYSCQKRPSDLVAPIPPPSKLDSNPRTLGLKPVSPDVYQQFIRNNNQESARTYVSCTSVDLTSKFPIPSQQGIQGSCVSWTVGYYIKTYWEGVEN